MSTRGNWAIYIRVGTRERVDGDLSRVKQELVKQGLVSEGLRVALYVRVPREAKSVDSDVQYGAALEYCREQNYSLSEKHIYVEERAEKELGVGPALTRLLEDARRREFDVVVVYSYECLAREEALIIDLTVFLAQDGVRIESVKSIA